MAESMYTEQVWRRIEGSFSGGGARHHHHHSMHRNEAGLNHMQLEVELPEYHSLPGGDTAGPPDLFRGESSKWEAIADLDRFFERIYQYYCDKGFWCIVTQWIVELLTLGFTISFSGFLLLFVNWRGLLHATCGVEGIEKTGRDCNLYEEALWPHPLKPFTFSTAVVVVYLTIFSFYWLFCFLRFFTQLRETLEIRDFCHNSLGVSEHELRTMKWPMLVDKLVEVQRRQRLCIVKELSAHDIVSRIMRKDNYLIGLLNKGVLALEVIRVFDDYIIKFKDREEKSNFLIRRDFTSNPARLRKRLMTVGLCMLMLSPFLIIFMLLYFFLRYAEQFYHQPSAAGSRRWSNLSRWTVREFNELDHMFKRRLNASYKYAVEYVKQFPSPIVSMVAKLVAFISGAFAAVLILVALFDETLLQAHIFNRNLFWHTAVLAAIIQVSRSLIAEEFQNFDPEGVMRQIAYHTHYMPKHWRGAENSDRVRREFEALFQYKGALFFEEMVSIFVTPFILWFYLPKCVDEVLQFVTEFTTTVDGVGSVCSLSVFDFEHHGNSKYGSPFHTSKDRRSSQGKMEKSFISFKSNYPNWEPDGNGKHLLSVLADFRSRKEDLGLFNLAHANSTLDARMRSIPRMGDSLYQRAADFSSRDRFGQRMPSSRPSPLDDVQDSAQFRENYGGPSIQQTDQMYWLDRYYTASQTAEPSVTSHASVDQRTNFESERQTGGHFQANISDSEIQENAPRPGIIQQIPGQGGESRWWDRRGPGSAMVPESSFEPPMFGRVGMLEESQDEYYESEEDHERSWINRRHSGSAYLSRQISDDEASHLDLPFGDAFDKPRDVSGADERPTSSNSKH
ncbi:hypothetical protein AXG93_1712s1200 [Marchantia polymorpha subsp. ruderalis]|uniref:Autophagy-related protein 9 n=1 Tax=Marchantia polymorpha subsp. ruderalis TaxID=1480154 RepID=A0A176W0E0_MARPO|nr:hypothetical protein AXG93_1712s1200 [Marchantia polymorpha subsp. ruderalis]